MNDTSPSKPPPILHDKDTDSPSVFIPENLLREARRQNTVSVGAVPEICVLDPDGDILRRLIEQGNAEHSPYWACYHTSLYTFHQDSVVFGIIGNAVGAPFAVLLAEQLFVSGCRLLISITSSGQISPDLEPPCFVLIDKALRDEGTSYHYQPPADFSHADADLLEQLKDAFCDLPFPIRRGASWTTDAPYRETQAAIDAKRDMGILAVEMEAAALYAFAQAKRKVVVCFAHVTNQMAQQEGDFEKGDASGADASLALIQAVARAVS